MQKFTKFALALVLALVAVVAKADIKTVYSWESPEGTVIEQGGTIAYVNGDGERLNYKQGDYYTICLNGKKANLGDTTPSANAGHMVITFTEPLKAGDKIVMTSFYAKGQDKEVSAYLGFENNVSVAGDLLPSTADINRDGSPVDITVTVPEAADGSKTLVLTREKSGTNLFISKFVITGERTAAAGWDKQTITTSLDGMILKTPEEFEGITLKFPGAKSIVPSEELYFNIEDTWNMGKDVYYVWTPQIGSTYEVNGDELTLNGFMNVYDLMGKGMDVEKMLKNAKKIQKTAAAEGETEYQYNFYGDGLIIDGDADWALGAYGNQIDLFFNCEEPTSGTQPFMFTSVSNNGVEGNATQAVQASEDGVMYQFEVLASGKALSKGEGVPTLSLVEDATVDFGAANLVAYETETAYIRFMTLQQPYFTQPGTYVLSIPEGTFVDAEGTPNAAVTVKWVIIQGEEPGTFAITGATNSGNAPESEVEALSYTFEITAANAIKALHEGNITLTDADNQPVGGNAYVFGYEGEGATTVYARFTFDTEDHQLHTPGVYTLNIPAGMFKDAEGNLNEAYTATWTVKASGDQTINIETVEVSTVTEESFFGTNDTYYTATVKFQKPEGAKYAQSNRGLIMVLNGEDTGVVFTLGVDGSAVELAEGDEVELTFKDAMIAATDDAAYDGDIRQPGSYVGETEIKFFNEENEELPVVAKFTGSIVLPNLNVVEIGEPSFNIAVAQEAGEKITKGWIESNGIVMTFPESQNITPDMQIKVVADLAVSASGFGQDEVDPGFGQPSFNVVQEDVEFIGGAEFGVATVAMSDFAQYAYEAGAGNMFQIIVKSIEVIGATGVEASWSATEEDVCGCAFAVTEDEPSEDVVLGEPVFNVDNDYHQGMISMDDLGVEGLSLQFPNAQNVTPEATIKVVASLSTSVPGYGAGDAGEEVDPGFGAPNIQEVIANAEFEGYISEDGIPTVMFQDFINYIAEAGAGAYVIDLKSIVVTQNDVDVYAWYANSEEGDIIGTIFEVTEMFEVEATATLAQTVPNEYGDQHYQVIVTIENSDNEVSAAGVAYAYTEGVIFYDEATWKEFTFNCEAQDGVEVVEEQDVVLTCTDALVSQTTSTDEVELRAEGTYPAYCIVVLMDADFNEIGAAQYNGELKLSKDIETGINTVKFNVTDVKFNLSGQRVNNSEKGIVIMNGKKYLTK